MMSCDKDKTATVFRKYVIPQQLAAGRNVTFRNRRRCVDICNRCNQRHQNKLMMYILVLLIHTEAIIFEMPIMLMVDAKHVMMTKA